MRNLKEIFTRQNLLEVGPGEDPDAEHLVVFTIFSKRFIEELENSPRTTDTLDTAKSMLQEAKRMNITFARLVAEEKLSRETCKLLCISETRIEKVIEECEEAI